MNRCVSFMGACLFHSLFFLNRQRECQKADASIFCSELQQMASWASWRNTRTHHNYNLYHNVCASVHFPSTFGSGTNFYVPGKGRQLEL